MNNQFHSPLFAIESKPNGKNRAPSCIVSYYYILSQLPFALLLSLSASVNFSCRCVEMQECPGVGLDVQDEVNEFHRPLSLLVWSRCTPRPRGPSKREKWKLIGLKQFVLSSFLHLSFFFSFSPLF